jgi:hypothetical protein
MNNQIMLTVEEEHDGYSHCDREHHACEDVMVKIEGQFQDDEKLAKKVFA